MKKTVECFLAIVVTLSVWIGNTSGTEITSVDYYARPQGEDMTLTGSGLSDPSAVTFLDTFNFDPTPAQSFSSASDDSLAVTFPELALTTFYLLVETASGSTVTPPPTRGRGSGLSPIIDFTGNGPVPSPTQQGVLRVRAGAVATSFPESSDFTMIYVESGAVIQGVPDDELNIIFAEDGATLDFRSNNFDDFAPRVSVFYSAGTTILGDLPPVGVIRQNTVRQITSPTLSTGIDLFSPAVRINVETVGNGTVSIDTGDFVVPPSTYVTLTATPAEGATFTSWSGAASSSDTILTFRTGISNVNLTATFSQGLELQTFNGGRGSITIEPDLPEYEDGQSVSLTATPAPGFEFAGWGADLAGETGITESLTMDAHKFVTAIFNPVNPATPTAITEVDHYTRPQGETSTLGGSGLSTPTAVTFLDSFNINHTPAQSFASLSDSALTVNFPELTPEKFYLLVETTEGSTVTPPPTRGRGSHTSPIIEFTGSGPVPTPTQQGILLVKSGAVATSLPESSDFTMIYVESGAALQGIPNDELNTIFAQDGATLDFRTNDFDEFAPRVSVFYSAGTVILGELPPIGVTGQNTIREISSPTLSTEVGLFSAAVRINVEVVGSGTVSIDTGDFVVPPSTDVTLTANPATGATFTAWSGAATSSNPVLQIRTGTTNLSLTANFSQGYELNTFTGNRGSITITPDLPQYPEGQSVELTVTPSPGFEFVGWGADLAGETSTSSSLTMDSHKFVTAIFSPLLPHPPTVVTSVDSFAAPPGDTITISGTGLSVPTAVTFLDSFNANPRPAPAFASLSDASLAVTFPDLTSEKYYLLVETASGSTVTPPPTRGRASVPSPTIEFTGSGPVPSPTQQGILLIKSGAVATSLPDGSDFTMIYVESGAVLQGVPNDELNTIFAQDGATLDFRSNDFDAFAPRVSVFYSSGTAILGELPPSGVSKQNTVREVTPITLSAGIDNFSRSYRIDLQIEGDGSVTVSPDQASYQLGDMVTVTATPGENSHFVRWSGVVNSIESTSVFRIRGRSELVARFSDRPDYFSEWRTRYFSQAELADPSISGLGADPDGDGFTNAAEYAFGTNPIVAEAGRSIQIRMADPSEGNSTMLIEYQRPVNAADISYNLLASTSLGRWEDGVSGTLKFDSVEQDIVEQGDDIEKVTLAVTFPEGLPDGAYFQLTTDISDLN